MIKIGGVSIDVSHPFAFAECLEKSELDMQYAYTCKESFRGDNEADAFVKRFNLEGRVDKIADMVDKVDVGFVQSCNWEKHLDQAMPFIEAGKPVFIDKPIVGSMADVARLRKLVAQGAKIMGSSSARHAKEIQEFLKIPVEKRGEVVSIFGTCGVDEFNYSIHIVEVLSELAGAKAVSCTFNGYGKCDDKTKLESYTIQYENGVQATYHTFIGGWRPFYLIVMTTKHAYRIAIDGSQIYIELLTQIHQELTTGQSALTDIETLINCTMTMLAGKKSRDQMQGATVSLDMLDENDKYDGYAFEKEYGAKAVEIYK